MKTQISPWGHSSAVRLPKKALQTSHILPSDEVEIIASEGEIVLRKIEKRDIDAILGPPHLDTTGYKFNREEANER
ncbi:hypothetical protein FACS189425_07980 [Clostridia bacterium]|nr:hypothetical protein FACS189425_07980 [Clostridia bacterium]